LPAASPRLDGRAVGLLHRSRTTTGGRPIKITLCKMRGTGVRDLIAFCSDYNAATASSRRRRWSINGRMICGCPTLNLGLYARFAASAVPS